MNPNMQRLDRGPPPHAPQQRGDAMHRPAGGFIGGCAGPLGTVRLLGGAGDSAKAASQRSRRLNLEGRVHAAQVRAEEGVENLLVVALMVVAVPPEPVASLGRLERLPRARRRVASPCRQKRTRLAQGAPGRVLFRMSDPDGEVVADP